jgi:hypothetical protein
MLWTYPRMLDSSRKAIQAKHSSLFRLNVSDQEKNYNIDNSGLYYKHVKIVNDNSSIINKWSFKLIDDARVVIYDRNRFMIQATGVNF